ncbi:fungal-specific transcription factor domain-containing protein [Immersiella caudata]|uniref:Fungal-specific transcription factor domain-containing protein n=1 Tax=Immersiella caudata TaxID=314043 RepID=A0AA39WSD5_9PEZI|nr:fungal-specific transcription factor domain-containing protein [Immersiella caudata]
MPVSRRTGSIGKGDGIVGQSRQQPGSACEECRKRKLRCDRQRPQCGTCADSGVICEINYNRLARGPKKGDLKALRCRIVALERRLSLDPSGDLLGICDPEMAPLDKMPTHSSGSDGELRHLPSPPDGGMGWDSEIQVQIPPGTPAVAPLPLPSFKFPPSPITHPQRTLVDDLMRADLDQLYFDRVHPNIPIFNQSRYLSQSRQCVTGDLVSSHKLCLQYAMWTLAMALSSQFESLRDTLYNETRQMLETLDLSEDDMGVVRIEQVQAWLLIAHYEFARANYRRGWVSAGRAFRLVQLAKLHEIDSPGNILDCEDPVLVEERRRTFWVAYCLDRFICMKSRWPLTLIEEVLCTRLPSPELAFQGGHPIRVCFLSEAIASHEHTMLSPLAECAILVTICGRAMSHSQVSNVERAAYGSASMDFWLRHEWLDDMLNKRLNALTMTYPAVSAVTDPMLLFAFMVAQTAVVYLASIVGGYGADSQYQPAVEEYQKRAISAGQEIARLSRAHEQIGYIKVSHPTYWHCSVTNLAKAHIFLPLTISLGASCLASPSCGHTEEIEVITSSFRLIDSDNFGPEMQSCFDALRKMQGFNNLAKDHLQVLERQHFSRDYIQ